MSGTLLPASFEALEPLIKDWAPDGELGRSVKRYSSSFAEVKLFYDAVLPYLDNMLETLGRYRLDDMPASVHNLYRLSLMFADIASAVEQFGSVRVPDTTLDPMLLKILHRNEKGLLADRG